MTASIPVLDWRGPEFLMFYGVGFAIALGWSLWRRFRFRARFSHPDAENAVLTDPYEIAYLAGGTPRCSQVVLVKLIKSGALEWKRAGIFRQSKLVASGPAEPGFNDIERNVYSSVLGHGQKGMALSGIPQLVSTRLSGIEAKLAKLGLRPTESEASGKAFMIVAPLFFLLLLGIVKLVIGVSRDKPVGFLIVFMIITFVAAIIVGASRKKLTPAGERLLGSMRADTTTGFQDPALAGVALLGASAMAHDPALAGLDEALKKDIAQMGEVTVSSGCSSGCSGGCGGGCGGCGGD